MTPRKQDPAKPGLRAAWRRLPRTAKVMALLTMCLGAALTLTVIFARMSPPNFEGSHEDSTGASGAAGDAPDGGSMPTRTGGAPSKGGEASHAPNEGSERALLDFEASVDAFAATRDDLALVAVVESWTAANETRAVPLLARRLTNDDADDGASEGNGDDPSSRSLGPSARGVFLQALGTLGRLSQNEADRLEAFEALVKRVAKAARRPTPQALGDGLLACEALVTLGFRGDTTLLLALLERETESLPWPLAERIVLTLDALGASETKRAAATLLRYLRTPPNPQFASMAADDKARLDALARPLSAPR